MTSRTRLPAGSGSSVSVVRSKFCAADCAGFSGCFIELLNWAPVPGAVLAMVEVPGRSGRVEEQPVTRRQAMVSQRSCLVLPVFMFVSPLNHDPEYDFIFTEASPAAR